jgi:hypothetical protein
MNNTTLIVIIVLIVFVFLLTYDPKTRRLDKYLPPAQVSQETSPDTSQGAPMCESERYHELQFNSKSDGKGCVGQQRESMGAVI